MADWLILLLFVPAIVIPVVLFVGFAGCTLDSEGAHVVGDPPIIVSAVGTSSSSITLTWTYKHVVAGFEVTATNFKFERNKVGEEAKSSFEAVSSPFEDTGPLDADTSFEYRVRAVLPAGLVSPWSELKPGKTLAIGPILESAVGTSSSSITLTWTFEGTAETFEVERTADKSTFEAVSSPAEATGLDAATSYEYHVRAVFSDGSVSDWSNVATATTLLLDVFEPTFEAPEVPLPNPGVEWQGYCLVQRIQAPSKGGESVRITLRASANSDTYIDRLYISRPDPDPAGDQYDSWADDLTPVHDVDGGYTPFKVPMGDTRSLSVNYHLVDSVPLLIAVDFSDAPPSGAAYADNVPPEVAVAYWHLGHEANKPDRGVNYVYDSDPRIYLIEKIEVL
jgi:hypothetical protein